MRQRGLILIFFLGAMGWVNAQDCLDKSYRLPVLGAETRSRMEIQLEEARTAYLRDSTHADVIIWYGRRLAYLGRYPEAIRVFSYGAKQHPGDARFLRHRGHRYITLRCNREAIADLTRAARMERGRKDQVEPDGMPNALNIPTSTLQTNIYYHLGLAYYLEKDFERAAGAWADCRQLSDNPDMFLAAAYWEYISLRRAEKTAEATALLEKVQTGLKLIENEDYYNLLLLYKGALTEAQLLSRLTPDAGSLSNATTGYALGIYYLLNGQAEKARDSWKQVQEGSQWASFGFIAAEKE